MPIDPPLRDAPRYPITVAIALAAIGSSLYWWSGNPISALLPIPTHLALQPWRLATSAFPHVNIVHLAFNLSWWWYFGTRIERAWGPARLIGLFLILAISSSAAEYALFSSGVGLSGVIYGLFTLLYFTQRTTPALAGSVSQKTAQIFGIWFLLCIGLTVAGVWHVGNVAHAAGAIVGAAIGRRIIAPPRLRPVWAAATALVVAATFVGATALRPWINMAHSGNANVYQGTLLLTGGKPDQAIPLLEAGVGEQPRNTVALTNLGIAYQKANRFDDALVMYKKVLAVDPSKAPGLFPSLASIRQHQAYDDTTKRNYATARTKAEESLRWNPEDSYTWRLLGLALAQLGELDGSLKAYERSVELAKPPERDSVAFREYIAEAIGAVHAQAGRHDQAATKFREGLTINPKNSRLWFELGGQLEALGSTDEALDAYEHAAASVEYEAQARTAADALRKKTGR